MQCPKCRYEPTMTEMRRSPDDCVECGVNFATHKAPTATEKLVRGIKGARAAVAEGRASRRSSLYCPCCGSVSDGETHTRGSILIELILWLCFLLPGLIYSVWRLSSRQRVCPSCHNPGLIPAGSPKAQKELSSR